MHILQMDRAAHQRAQRDAHLAERQRQLEEEKKRVGQQEDAKHRADDNLLQRLHRPNECQNHGFQQEAERQSSQHVRLLCIGTCDTSHQRLRLAGTQETDANRKRDLKNWEGEITFFEAEQAAKACSQIIMQT